MFVSTDGKNRMTRCHRGVVTHLKQAAKFSMLHIWCVPHQIDIVIKNMVALPQDGQCIEVVFKWGMHLHREEKFIMTMNGEMCLKKINRLAHFDGMFKCYILGQCKIVEHTDAHVEIKSLSTKWWMIKIVVVLTINEINKTVVLL
jgi:hypothetical protein